MKTRLRLALPPLAEITPDSIIAFALFDRADRLLRSGELPLKQLAEAVPVDYVQAILHPGDAIIVTIKLPPLPAKRLDAAVQASVEPMALSDLDDLCISHGPRATDGSIPVAWTERHTLLKAWRQLDDAGLKLVAIVPLALALPSDDPYPDKALALPVDARWHAPLPRWSLARPEWRPTSQTHRWRGAAAWVGAAALLWLLGLHIYALQLRGEARALQTATEKAVLAAFPSIAIIVDPVKQARSQRDALRLAAGAAGSDDFMPLSLGAAKVLGFADGHVASLLYEKGKLTLVLTETYTPPSNEAVLHQAAAIQSLTLSKDNKAAHTWHFQRADTRPTQEVRR